jgi:exonuclease SbcC
VRPLELTVTGLRSHRTTTTVTFPDDWRLAAVVGPTGAGKSSLLEAIVYALFGSGTVPGASQPTNLITDDSREMRVVFRFAVGSERFEIARTYRRVGNVQPVLKGAARTYSGAREVEEAVTRLLGLRQGAFCSTVLLPQGQFATLLQAGSGVQKETLDAFFKLTEVTEVAGRLVAAAAALAGRRREVEAVRDQLPHDPGAVVQEAERRLREADRRRAAADELAEVVSRHERDAIATSTRAETARQRAAELVTGAGALDEVAAAAVRLEALAIELTSAGEALAERTELAAAAVRETHEALGALDAPGLERSAARVETLLARITEASAAKDQAACRAADAEQARVELKVIRTAHSRAADKRDHARADHERSCATETSARACVERLRNLADESRRSSIVRDAADSRRAAAATDCSLAEAAEQQARQWLTEAVAKLATAEGAAAAAKMVLAEAEAGAAAAAERAEHLGRLRRELDEQRAARDRVAGELTASRAGLEGARTIVDQAARAESQAEARWQQAQTICQEARREDAAAAAAAGCGPGDPCPVCARELPDGFASPAPSINTKGAEAAGQAADVELASCRRATVRAETEVDARAREEAGAADQLGATKLALAKAEHLLAVEGGVEGAERAAAAVAAARERLESGRRADRTTAGLLMEARAEQGAIERSIEPLAAATRRARTTLASATADRDQAARVSDEARNAFADAGGDDALATAERHFATATEGMETSKVALEGAEASARDAEVRLGQAEPNAAALGAAAESAAAQSRLATEAATQAASIIPAEARRGARADPAGIADDARLWVAERRALIAEADRSRVEAETALDRARRAATDLRARRVAELDGPLTGATSNGARLAAIADVPSPTVTLGPAGLAGWATAAADKTRKRAEDRRREGEAADAEAAGARATAHVACEAAGVDRDDLEGWRAETQREVGAAMEARRRATETAERAHTLDAALATSAHRTRLLGLARDLCQGKESFANHVLVARRQGLIAEAAAILVELSSGRLTFAEDVAATFSVLDTGTGAVRDPRLLSGGEQFQASLALALGLVEIAARAGARIECLFLDEGFGALDAASLDIALDALESAARRGRRIVAVTHVDAVTARADQVLAVRGSEAGSHAEWRTTELPAGV